MSTRSAASVVVRSKPEFFVEFSRAVIPAAGPVLSLVGPRNSETVTRPKIPVLLAGLQACASSRKTPEFVNSIAQITLIEVLLITMQTVNLTHDESVFKDVISLTLI
jgi:hypothetical protein